MYKYYQSRPSTINGSAQTQAMTSSETATLSKFDKHRETLLSEDMEEGCVRLRNVKAKRLTVSTRVFVVKEVCKNAEEELCITSIRLQSVV
jgi:hypothetical protein